MKRVLCALCVNKLDQSLRRIVASRRAPVVAVDKTTRLRSVATVDRKRCQSVAARKQDFDVSV